MKKVSLNNVCLAVAVLVYGVAAVQPNNVETTTYDVDGNVNAAVDPANDVVTTEYSDGLSRGIQTKLRLNSSKDRVSCTFYDEAGRPKIATKSFVDDQHEGKYLPGDLNDAAVFDQLKAVNLNDDRAYSETEYWDDPLGRVRTITKPGVADAVFQDSTWTFGVGYEATEIIPALSSGSDVKITNGMITEILPDGGLTVSEVLDELYDYLLANTASNTPFGVAKTHFLTVTLTVDDGSSGSDVARISEELKDIFGRTVRTFTAPTIGSIAGSKLSGQYHHDILGNVLTETPPVATTFPLKNTTYTYNTLGQVISKQMPDNDGEYLYTYDDDGLLASEEFRRSGSTKSLLNFTYDVLKRETEIEQVLPPTCGRPVVRRYYDRIENVPNEHSSKIPATFTARMSNTKGRLVCSVGYNYVGEIFRVIKFYSYDDEGRTQFTATVIEGTPGVQETRYEYDLHGKVKADYSYLNDDIIKKRYEYDSFGRLAKIVHCRLNADGTDHSEKEVANYTYDDLGRLVTKGLSQIAGYDLSYEFDIRDRLNSITKPAFQRGFDEYDITYGKAGNILGAKYVYNMPADYRLFEMTYQYDDLNRLTDVVSSRDQATYNAEYEYDEVGRFKMKNEGASLLTGYSYYGNIADGYSNRLKCTSKNPDIPQEYVYTMEGNLKVDFTKNMVTDHDWRNLPKRYTFYDNLSSAGITKNAESGMFISTQLYSKVRDGFIRQVSSVVMLYDADGKRVCKMDVTE